MSLAGFQHALCELIASPALCRRLAASATSAASAAGEAGEDGGVLGRYALTEREERRLLAVARQRGMATNCTLYRANRLSPLRSLLPRTCVLLGPRLRAELDAYLEVHRETDLEFRREIEAFGRSLLGRWQAGEIPIPALPEVVAFELAAHELQSLPRRDVLARLEAEPGAGPSRLHPLVRVLRFRYDPAALLPPLVAGEPLPADLSEGEFFLLLDARSDEMTSSALPPALGRVLSGLGGPGGPPLLRQDEADLAAAGLVVRG
jgi:hypothetical protein